MSTNKKRAADRQNRQAPKSDDDARRQGHHTQQASQSPPVPGCMCGLCGDPDNAPRPHNLASRGKYRHITEDVFEWVRTNRRFTKKQLNAGVPQWATANGFWGALNRLQRRGLICYRFDRQAKVYVVYWMAGEDDAPMGGAS